MAEKLQWDVYVPIFKNRFILKDLAVAIGIPFGILIALILYISNGDVSGTDAKYALGMIALLFLLAFVVVMLVYGGKYAPGFVIDQAGITNFTQAEQAKRNKRLNGALIAVGLLTGKPAAAGAGVLAQSRQVTQLKWTQVRKVQYYPDRHAIVLRGGFAEKMVVFCTEENYPQVEAMVRESTATARR